MPIILLLFVRAWWLNRNARRRIISRLILVIARPIVNKFCHVFEGDLGL